MNFYIYDGETKEYLGTQRAYLNPIATKKKGEDSYLVPPNSTLVKPKAKLKSNQTYVFDGEKWEIVSDYRGITYYINNEPHTMLQLGDLPSGATLEPISPINDTSKDPEGSIRISGHLVTIG